MHCNLNTLKEIFNRDLQKLCEEIQNYKDEISIWSVSDGITNSGGNLCLHLCGNLQYFIGAVLGKTDYARNRDAEFSSRNIAKEKLIDEIMATRNVIEKTLDTMNGDDMAKEYPFNVLGNIHTTEFFLIHLISHLNYHLGQINYHRRLLEK